ncbi:hypothetical protein PACILC2_25400 [Paenibacillus cisolokensis]|uniref:Uncharacterized protein n=1 Tax=Paenibacillus cisolokensis TaxID=1658519 RepID=A0ABQ4N731_9BACL|nr:hypothetical protein PACILC2_25400 [Paenibacillus cisolokensis]
MKPVLAALGANRFTSAVYAVDSQIVRSDRPDGELEFTLDTELRTRLDAVLDELLLELGAGTHA